MLTASNRAESSKQRGESANEMATAVTCGRVGSHPEVCRASEPGPCWAVCGAVCPPARPRTRPGAVAMDKAYSPCGNRSYLHKRNIKAVIPE